MPVRNGCPGGGKLMPRTLAWNWATDWGMMGEACGEVGGAFQVLFLLCRFMYDLCMIFGPTYIVKLRINTGDSGALCRYV